MKLDQLEQLAREATPGPWCVQDAAASDPANNIWGIARWIEELERESSIMFAKTDCREHIHSTCIDIDRRDARYIAAADPTTVLKLIAVARAAAQWEKTNEYPVYEADRQALVDALAALERTYPSPA